MSNVIGFFRKVRRLKAAVDVDLLHAILLQANKRARNIPQNNDAPASAAQQRRTAVSVL
jgi:hypothetical protein